MLTNITCLYLYFFRIYKNCIDSFQTPQSITIWMILHVVKRLQHGAEQRQTDITHDCPEPLLGESIEIQKTKLEIVHPNYQMRISLSTRIESQHLKSRPISKNIKNIKEGRPNVRKRKQVISLG